ncbi:MAG: HYC_CC_PP family protein [Thermaurantimonas sp.]
MIKKVFRKILSLVLVPMIIGAQTGIVFSLHYCKGDLIDSSLYLPVDGCESYNIDSRGCYEDASSVCSEYISSDCCFTQVFSIQTDHNLLHKSKAEIQHCFDHLVGIQPILRHHCFFVRPETGAIRPPALLHSVPLYIKYRVLRYYG